ncbi:cell surface protein [Lactiplantibacillus herbarum]|uniref:sunset domain-containing protein n=1 Tax=Lactiplantibacillus herbarum TaxID=1670446 RepID=UPI00064FC6BD|nr:cell surface protein [Lactiplantibacillus herbarum]
MHHAKRILVTLTSLLILTGCTTTTKSSDHDTVQTKTVRVDKRTAANKTAWAQAKASSRANAASAKRLSSSAKVLDEATNQASSQSEQLSSSHESSVAEQESSSQAASSSAAAQSRSQAKASSKAASSASSAAAEASQTQTSSANTSRQNNFSGDTDTAQTGRIVGNLRSKIYHVETGHNYQMAGKNVVYFSTEAEAQAAGYRKSQR